jgi:twinkle protein
MISQFQEIGIKISSTNGVQQKTTCPNCVRIGKQNYKDKCLSVNVDQGVYNCHKCGWRGTVNKKEMSKVYKLPSTDKFKSLSDKARNYLNSRGISDKVIDNNKIKSSVDGRMIMFPYYRNGSVTNYKTRGVDGKFFTQAKDAEPIIYNYDNCVGGKRIVICEGEIDSLSWEEAGCIAHTSVNMGAPNPTDTTIDKKLQCIDNSYEVFDEAKLVYIAVDNDENGRVLQKELIRRIGPEKCKIVDLSPFKDANEVLLKEGKESLVERLKNALEPKVEGVFTVEDVYDSLMDTFHNGQDIGTTTYIPQVDKAWTWRNGEVNIWTGYQNEGKSLFLNQLALVKSIKAGWKFAVFSPENMPIDDFFNDLAHMYIGKTTDKRYATQMTVEEYQEALQFIRDHFFIIYPPKDFLLSSIVDRAKYLVRTKGIRSLIIDPYNTIQHKMLKGEREDLYISRFMSKLKRFAVENDISIHLVAHQLTPRKDESGRYPKPDVNYIKGGSEFANKADNVLFVWRPHRAINFQDKTVVFGSQKIKKQKLVGYPQDVENIDFNIVSNRYYFNGDTPFTSIDSERTSKSQSIITSALHSDEDQEKVVNFE